MSMQLEQNLYVIYRMFLKIPRLLYLLALIAIVIVFGIQVVTMYSNHQRVEIGRCLLDYVRQKHRSEHNNTLQNRTVVNETSNVTIIDEYYLVDDTTVMHFEMGASQKCTIYIDYPYKYDIGNLPGLVLTRNDQLNHMKSKSPQYLKAHSITYDKVVMPQLRIQKPWFSFFYNEDMFLNEKLVQSLRISLIKMQYEFLLMIMKQNMTNVRLVMNELHLSYYSQLSENVYQNTINMVQSVSLLLHRGVLLKVIVMIGMALLLYSFAMFVGLFLRYSIVLVYTVFLLGYYRCSHDGWGWIYQYLSLLCQRFRLNTVTTFKFMLFYVLANVGMYGLLALGAYEVLRKIFYPILPFPTQMYNTFFFKTIFLVQLFSYVCCRSRISIRYFPILSFMGCYLTLTISALMQYGSIMSLLNINCSYQIILFILFLIIEQAIQRQGEDGLIGSYCPTLLKPRMMFYVGYDISWERTLPPIWTYFTGWFDYGHFNQGQKSYIDRDYQLLYGRMLGLNQRQQIPDVEHEEEEVELHGERGRQQRSNQMNLIHNDL